MVVATDKQTDGLLSLGFRAGLAAGAAAGGFELAHRHPLEVAVLRQQNDRALVRDQIDVFQPPFDIEDLGAARGVVAGADHPQLLGDQAIDPFFAGQDVLVIGDLGEQVLVLKADLVGLEGGQATQLHLQDRVGLDFTQPELLHQIQPGGRRVSGPADQGNDRVEVVQRDQ